MTLGLVLGLLSGMGLLLCGTAVARTSPPMWLLIAPYVGSAMAPQPSWKSNVTHLASKGLMHRPQSIWGNDRLVTQLLTQAAYSGTLRAFRQQQIRCAGIATLGTSSWIVLRMASHNKFSPVVGILALATAPILGGWYAKWSLANSAANRITRIEQQLPTILDLLAFALAAGQAILPALKKISQMCSGDLAEELSQVVTSVSTGVPLSDALDAAQLRVGSEALSRAIRSLTVALERGTPLAVVLRAQATDARHLAQRRLIELASKKETAMMLPVVFFILPMIVVVALYPGLIALQML
jgi:tight adherence protein C